MTEWLKEIALGMGGVLLGWLNIRLSRLEESKVSKDVFEEFKSNNETHHERTHDALQRICDKLNML